MKHRTDGKSRPCHAVIDSLFRLFFRIAYTLARVYWFFVRPTMAGANIFVWHSERLLIIRNSYRRLRTVPGGYIKPGESPRLAARRELFEEVGIEVGAEELRFRGVRESRENFKWGRNFQFEYVASSEPVVRIDNRELVSAAFHTPKEALRLPLSLPVREYLSSSREHRYRRH